MKFRLEAKENRERIAELEVTVDKLRHELKSLCEAGSSDPSGSTVSESDDATVVADLHETTASPRHQEVNFLLTFLL